MRPLKKAGLCEEIEMSQCYETTSGTTHSRSHAGFLASLDRAALQVADQLSRYARRIQERRALGRLDDRMLSDIGLSHADVEQEMSKPFWRP